MMQNNQNNNRKQLWKDKGYYILLSLCLVVVGVSAVVFVTGAIRENRAVEETLAMPEPMAEAPDDPEAAKREAAAQVPEPEEVPVASPVPVEEQAVLPVSGIVVRDYAMDHLAYNDTTRDWRVHNGVDLAAPLGEDVVSAKSGTVQAVYEDDYLGMTVVVQHDGGYTTHYCNLAPEPPVEAGEAITVGQILGQVGDSALLEIGDEPHLHFEVYQDGNPVDPAAFLY